MKPAESLVGFDAVATRQTRLDAALHLVDDRGAAVRDRLRAATAQIAEHARVSAPLGAANPIDTARTVAPLNNIFVITRRSP